MTEASNDDQSIKRATQIQPGPGDGSANFSQKDYHHPLPLGAALSVGEVLVKQNALVDALSIFKMNHDNQGSTVQDAHGRMIAKD